MLRFWHGIHVRTLPVKFQQRSAALGFAIFHSRDWIVRFISSVSAVKAEPIADPIRVFVARFQFREGQAAMHLYIGRLVTLAVQWMRRWNPDITATVGGFTRENDGARQSRMRPFFLNLVRLYG